VRLGQRRVAVGRDVVGDAEAFARHAVEEVALDRLVWRVGDRMDESVEPSSPCRVRRTGR